MRPDLGTQTVGAIEPSTSTPRTAPSHPVTKHAPAAERPTHNPVRKQHHKKRRKAKAGDLPLKVTPPLGLSGYVFPVVGPSDYVDTYGAFRGDVPGNWHHGDDIFAPLGAPVVAVASGTLNQVGWERVGGWRLWVRDSLGNEFYYAHLSGYAPAALDSNRVRAGEVVGFIGNTGDAFTTSPHLHFEIHPRTLLYLHYGGAVDPTTYLNHWRHLQRVRAPRPDLPSLPRGTVRQEARFVFRELLAARHLIKHAPKFSQRPRIQVPGASPLLPAENRIQREALGARVRQHTHALSLPLAALVVLSLPALVALLLWGAPIGSRIARRMSGQASETSNN